MNSKIYILYFVVISLSMTFSSCSNKNKEDIEKDMATGVVMVKTSSFYEIEFPDITMYLNSFSNGNLDGFTFNPDSVYTSTSFGTGFFISDAGEIVTNAHVVQDLLSEREKKLQIRSFFKANVKSLQATYKEKKEKFEENCDTYRYAYQFERNEYTKEQFESYYEMLEEQQEELEYYKLLISSLKELDFNEMKIIPHHEVSIAYNNHYVTSYDDFSKCIVKKVDTDHDLALIQLKDKQTPEGKYSFSIPEGDPLTDYSFGDKITSKFSSDKNSTLYMKGFNRGPQLAITDDGLKAQFLNGSISQKEKDRIMYSIPSLHGSSGSPVVNQAGELVAVNYAGLDDTQSFNYGIRIQHLKNLLGK